MPLKEDERRELKDAVAEASQAHQERTHQRRRDWGIGDIIKLIEQASLMGVPRAPNRWEEVNKEGPSRG